MTVKQALAIIILSIILFLGAATTILGYMVIDLKKQNAVWQENLYQNLNERDQAIILQNQKQFEKLYPKLDSIAKASGINKNITHVHYTDYYYKTDSIKTVLIPVETNNKNDTVFAFDIDTACLEISGIVNVPQKQLIFGNISLKDEVTTFYYKERDRLFGWSWTPKWGQWQYRAKSVSDCTDSISTIDIQIEKNK